VGNHQISIQKGLVGSSMKEDGSGSIGKGRMEKNCLQRKCIAIN
jgi:hypothetical protein